MKARKLTPISSVRSTPDMHPALVLERARELAARVNGRSQPAANQPINGATAKGIYDGAELGPATTRPGAMDAFACPSRVDGRLFYRDGRTGEVS